MEEKIKQYLADIKFSEQYEKLTENIKNKTVIIYGAGNFFKAICENYGLSKLNILGVCDKKFSKNDKEDLISGYKKIPYEELTKYSADFVLVSLLDYARIVRSLQKKVFNNSNTVVLPIAVRNFDNNLIKNGKYIIIGSQIVVDKTLSLIGCENFEKIKGVCLPDKVEYDKNCFKNFSNDEILKLYNDKQINGVILPLCYADINSYSVIEDVVEMGFKKEDIYPVSVSTFNIPLHNKKDLPKTFENVNEFLELPVLKFLLSQHCNLNCTGCSHFAPLVKEKKILSFSEFKSDLDRMNELFKEIRLISLLGGEPLLNENLGKMLLYAREKFPYSNLEVITNGILLPKMKDELFEAFRKTNTFVSVTAYPKNQNIIGKIDKLLAENRVEYKIFYPSTSRHIFYKKYNLKGNENPEERFYNCFSRICHTINKKRIAACYYPVTVERANKFFNLDIPWKDSSIDIYDKNLTAKELLYKLSHPMEICRYCSKPQPFDWNKTDAPPKLEDYFLI